MKKNILSIIALVIALGALIFAFATTQQLTGRIENLEQHNAALTLKLQQLSGKQEIFYPEDNDSLYCSLMVESWNYEAGKLTITGGYAEAHLPAIASTCESTLSLKYNGEILYAQPLELIPAETGTAFEAALQGISFDLPELTDADLLELWLDVSAGGKTQSVSGVEWYLENGQFMMSAG